MARVRTTLPRRATLALLGALAATALACTPRAEPGQVQSPTAAATESTPTGATAPAAGASADANANATPAALTTPPLRGVSVLTLQLQHLPALASGHYEGWALLGEDRVSTGKFAVTSAGELQSLSGTAIRAFPLTRDIVTATRVLITIEPDGDRDTAPSGIVVLDGPVVRGRAVLAFPPNTAPLAGSVVLATPTDDNAANETAGAWLATPDGRPALTASAPPRGWVYEGWIGTQDLQFTMGRFTGATGPDSARPTSGPRPGLDVPGEDLVDRLPPTLRGPVNLADGASTIEVSLEPDRDGQDPTGPGTFGAPVLRARIPAGGGPLQPVPFEVDTTQLPAGVATIG